MQDLPKYVAHNGARHEVLVKPSGAVALWQSPRPRWGRAASIPTTSEAVATMETWDAYKARREAAKRRDAGTCQVCGRPIHRATGRIAHHGYTRPLPGWQTHSCDGARELPFEKSRDALGRHIEGQRNRIPHIRGLIERIEAGTYSAPIRIDHRGKPPTFHDVGTPQWDAAAAAWLGQLRGELAALPDYIKQQQARFNAWVQTE